MFDATTKKMNVKSTPNHDKIIIIGPAGLHRADLMYRWYASKATIAKSSAMKCCLCHSKIRRGNKIRNYNGNHKAYVIHDDCFNLYYDIISPYTA